MRARTTTVAIAASALALILAACGAADVGTTDTSVSAPPTTTPSQAETVDHEAMDTDMGDSAATPAYEVVGAAVVSGPFEVLADITDDGITGTAWLARHANGTTVSIELSGLTAGSQYLSHVHVDACDTGAGPHYRHDPDGTAQPPNEIHLAFTADGEGSGSMTVVNPTVASDLAVSVVVHEASMGAPKLACADLSG